MEEQKTARRGVRLIEPEETLKFKLSEDLETEFIYRRVPDHLKAQWAIECIRDSRSNEVDAVALLWKALSYGLLGWRGVFDSRGREVPFTLESAKQLDTYILTALRDRINGARAFAESEVPEVPLSV